MGIWDRIARLLGRRGRTPLEQARAASKTLRRKGYEKRSRRPPRPYERMEGGVTWGGDSWTDSVNSHNSDGGGSGGGGGGSD